ARPVASPARATPTTAHGLPRPATRLIGRDREIAACERLLERARLVTLAGLGGSGKARLAVRLAERAAGDGTDVWWIDLSVLQDSVQVAPAAAAALGLREGPDQPPLRLLVARLRERARPPRP